VPGSLIPPAARLLGLALRDTLLTAEEFQAMADGLADTDGPATGEISLTKWITDHKGTLGRTYANELTRHFRLLFTERTVVSRPATQMRERLT